MRAMLLPCSTTLTHGAADTPGAALTSLAERPISRSSDVAPARRSSIPALTDDASEPCRAALPPVAAIRVAAAQEAGAGLAAVRSDEPIPRAAQTCQARPLHGRADRADHGPRGPPGPPAGIIRLLTQIQDTLGEHQDAVVAAGEIEPCSRQTSARLGVRPGRPAACSHPSTSKAHATRDLFSRSGTSWTARNRVAG